jgi:hypothetical protein
VPSILLLLLLFDSELLFDSDFDSDVDFLLFSSRTTIYFKDFDFKAIAASRNRSIYGINSEQIRRQFRRHE